MLGTKELHALAKEVAALSGYRSVQAYYRHLLRVSVVRDARRLGLFDTQSTHTTDTTQTGEDVCQTT